jgi:thioredoxin 2
MMKIDLVCPACSALNRVPPEKLGDRPHCGACHKPLFAGQPITVNGAALDRHICQDGVAVLVDVWAPWCGPCHAMAPHYELAAAQLEPKVRLLRLNADSAPEIVSRYEVRTIPTLLLFNDGILLAQQSGAMTTAQIVHWVGEQVQR